LFYHSSSAAIKGHRDVVYLLIDYGANCMAKNNEGKTVHDVLPVSGGRGGSLMMTSMDLHLYKALQPTRSALGKLSNTCQRHDQELANLRDQMARQRKADFDTLRRETHAVQTSLQQALQAQRNEFLALLRNNGGGGGGGGGGEINSTTMQQQLQDQQEHNPVATSTPSFANSSSISNEYNASAKSSLKEKSLIKSPVPSLSLAAAGRSCSVGNFAASSSSSSSTAAADATAALALQRLVLQRNNDMSTLRREIQSTQESLAKLLSSQVEDKVKSTILKEMQKQQPHSGSSNNENAISGSNDLRKDLAALRNEFTANKENILAEMTNLKTEIMLVQKSSSGGNNNAVTARSRGSLSSTEIGDENDAFAVREDDSHLKQLQRKKTEKEEAAISAMRDAFMSKHQADLETVRAEIVAAEEHLMGLFQQQNSTASSSPLLKKRSSAPEMENHDPDESTCQGEEGDYVTHAELKKSLRKKTRKQEASLAELREEFTKLMEFLEHVDVGSLRDDMMELVSSQVEQQNAAVAELREAIQENQQPQHKKGTRGLPSIQEANKKADRSGEDDEGDEEDDEDDEEEEEEEEEGDITLEELKNSLEAQSEAQQKAMTALSDKLSLQRKQDLAALREETTSTREHLEHQMQQQSELQETILAALRDELSTGVVSPSCKPGETLNGIRDEILGMEESLKALIHSHSKKQDMALATLQKKLAMKEKDGKSAASDDKSLKLIRKQQEELKSQQQSDILSLKKEIHATKVSLKRLSDQQKSNQTSAVQVSRRTGVAPAGNEDSKAAYEDLKRLVEEQEEGQRAAITMLQKDIRAANEKLNQLSGEPEGKSVLASPSQNGRPKWSPRSLMSPMSPKSRSARDVLNASHYAQDDIAALQKDIEAIKERLKEVTDQQQQHGMAALEERFVAKEQINRVIQQSLSEQDSQREAQMQNLIKTQQELDELIQSLEEHKSISSGAQKVAIDKKQENQLRADIADLRAVVSKYLLGLEETIQEIAALREQGKVPDVLAGASDANSKDSVVLEELDRMLDGQSKRSSNGEEVSLQEELLKVMAELKMARAVADRYKETVIQLHQISEQALT
jgi:hypothetical protein